MILGTRKISRIKVREYEKQIHQIVYKLYGLTQEEIEVMEGNIK